jgi:hypothetical protein
LFQQFFAIWAGIPCGVDKDDVLVPFTIDFGYVVAILVVTDLRAETALPRSARDTHCEGKEN